MNPFTRTLILLTGLVLLLAACGAEEEQPVLTDFERFLVDVFAPEAGEKVLVLVDLPHEQIMDNPSWVDRRAMAEAWHAGFHELGQKLGFTVHPLLTYPATGRHSGPLPAAGQLNGEEVSFDDILANTNIAVAMTEFSATAPLVSFTERLPELRAASMPMVSRSMERTALAADYGQMAELCYTLGERLDRADGALLTFSTGHELFVDLRFRQARVDDGRLPPNKENDRVINLPSGEAYIAPYEGEREGDPSQTGGYVPIPAGDGRFALARLEENRVVELIDENGEAVAVAEAMGADPAGHNLAELGLGCNDKAVVTGNVLEDEKVLGVHLAAGLSEHIGGTVGVDDYSDPANAAHEDRVMPFGGEVEIVRLVLEYEDDGTEAIIENGAYSIPDSD